MKKNNIEIMIEGLDFRQDVEPLIKEFFPDFRNDRDVRIELYLREEGFDIYVKEIDGESGKDEPMPEDAADKDTERTVAAVVDEKFDLSSENDVKIRHRIYRNRLLQGIYRALCEYTGRTLPWGILTGVRPTKLLFERIGRGEGQPLAFMRKNYYCSEKKASLAARVAALEYQLLDRIDYKNGYSLYIGIPFCPSICNYCTFGSHPIGAFAELVEPYIEALMKEIRYASGYFKDLKLKTIYMGGGTPTSLEASQLERIINCVWDHFDTCDLREFTVEAGRPDSITDEKLAMLKSCGIERISVNPQTFSQRTLDLIGRAHTVEKVNEAFELARKHGFGNINMDLIAGLTGETEDDFRNTLKCVGKLDPDAVTVHTLARKRAARITTQPELYEGYSSGNVEAMLELAEKFMKENGYGPYYMYRQKNMTGNLENVGYARPGKECLYNILIMEEVHPILAVGAGASSKLVSDSSGRFGRIENVKNVREYVSRIDEMIARKEAGI